MCDVDGTIDKNSKSDAAVINEIEEYQMYAYLELKRKIYCLRDFDYDLLTLGIDLECWDSLQVRLRPIKNNARKSNIFGTISPVSSRYLLPVSFTASFFSQKLSCPSDGNRK